MRLIVVASVVSLTAFAQSLIAQDVKPSATVAATKYTCVMHPEVVRDKPGKCPKCGMALVPMKSKPNPLPSRSEHASHDMQMPMHSMSMQSSVSIADPMSRESSGTAGTGLHAHVWQDAHVR